MHESNHPALENAFSPETQEMLRKEDAQAWAAVTGILFIIVAGGALLGIVGVLLAI